MDSVHASICSISDSELHRGMWYFLSYAFGVMQNNLGDYQLLLENKPEHHAPAWHVHGLLGHVYNSLDAAKRLREKTGFDAVETMAFHDIGKARQFAKAVRLFEEKKDVANAYTGHEWKSVEVAKNYLSSDKVEAIACHDFAYLPIKPWKVVARLQNDATIVMFWMVVCAADAVAKGFTQAQMQQRPVVAERIRKIGELIKPQENPKVIEACCEAIEKWEPIPREKVPSFC